MFGVLVARDPESDQQVELKAFSGQIQGSWLLPGWAPPLFCVDTWSQRYRQLEPQIKAATLAIEALPKRGPARAQPVAERRRLCRALVQRLNELYRFRNFRGQTRSCEQLFPERSPPTGTGDCCAPKLLNWAIERRLEPIALVEFFWGDAPGGQRKHGQYYPSCPEKCGLILGFMLCGCRAAMGA